MITSVSMIRVRGFSALLCTSSSTPGLTPKPQAAAIEDYKSRFPKDIWVVLIHGETDRSVMQDAVLSGLIGFAVMAVRPNAGHFVVKKTCLPEFRHGSTVVREDIQRYARS